MAKAQSPTIGTATTTHPYTLVYTDSSMLFFNLMPPPNEQLANDRLFSISTPNMDQILTNTNGIHSITITFPTSDS